MKKITRREFLSKAVFGISAAALSSACAAQDLSPSQPSPSPTDQDTYSQSTATSQSPINTQQASLPTQTHLGAPESTPQTQSLQYPHLVVARHGSPEMMVEQALSALGGMERFVHQGASVIIKPNICVAYHTYEYAATTNPWVVGALVRLCIAAGAKSVRVMDFPFGGTPQEAYARSGIQDQVIAAGGEMMDMPKFRFVPTKIPDGIDLKKAEIFDELQMTDVLIDVPVAKHHSLAQLTLGMKNLMGLIWDRPAIHRNIGQRLSDLTSLLRPTLTVIDAVRMLMANGPTGGSLGDVKQADTIIASPDIVAADSFAATLFGVSPENLSYVSAGTAMGLGRSDLQNMKIEEFSISA